MKQKEAKTHKSIRAFDCLEVCFTDVNKEDVKLYLKTAQLKKKIGTIDGKKFGTYVLHNVTCTPDADEGLKFVFINTYIRNNPDGVKIYDECIDKFNVFVKLLMEELMNKCNGALDLKFELVRVNADDLSALDECIFYDYYTVASIIEKLTEKFEIVEEDSAKEKVSEDAENDKGENVN